MRAVSILAVICSHGLWWPTGYLGVKIFFVISGFLITMLLLREQRSSGSISLRGFYMRRALRIIPAYACYLIFVFIMTRAGLARLDSLDWFGVLTYTANLIDGKAGIIAHMWSLSMEEQFYVLWPPVLYFAGVQRSRRILLAYLLLAPVLRAACRVFLPQYKALAYTGVFAMTPIVVGCFLALFVFEDRFRRIAHVPARRAPLVLAGCCVIVATSFFLSRWSVYSILMDDFVTGIGIAAIIWVNGIQPRTWLGAVLNWSPMVVLGTLSYSIYIWQQPFLVGDLVTISRPQNLLPPIMAGALSYLLVERPFLRIKDRYTAHPKKSIPAPKAPTAGAHSDGIRA